KEVPGSRLDRFQARVARPRRRILLTAISLALGDKEFHKGREIGSHASPILIPDDHAWFPRVASKVKSVHVSCAARAEPGMIIEAGEVLDEAGLIEERLILLEPVLLPEHPLQLARLLRNDFQIRI